MERAHARELGRRVEMAEAAAERAAVAGLEVADEAERFGEDRAGALHLRGALERALAGHRADLERAAPGRM